MPKNILEGLVGKSKEQGGIIATDENAYKAGFPYGVLNDSRSFLTNKDLREESSRLVSKDEDMRLEVGRRGDLGRGVNLEDKQHKPR